MDTFLIVLPLLLPVFLIFTPLRRELGFTSLQLSDLLFRSFALASYELSRVLDFLSFGSLNLGDTNSPVYCLFSYYSGGENVKNC